MKKPTSTTPVIDLIVSSKISGFTGLSHKMSNIIFPLSVITGPHFFTASLKVQWAPSYSNRRITANRASGITSTGKGNFVPKESTIFDSSATTMNRFAL